MCFVLQWTLRVRGGALVTRRTGLVPLHFCVLSLSISTSTKHKQPDSRMVLPHSSMP